MSLLVQSPDLGLNSLLQENQLNPRNAAKGTQNIFYENGLAYTPYGFAKLDMTAIDNFNDTVLGIFPYTELDKYSHLIAVTTEKIYDHDNVNEEWDDKTQSGVTMSSNINHPISYAEVGHDDTAIYIDDDTGKAKSYFHVVVCDGGLSNIQRWAGRYEADFGDLVGADGYHDGTTHRALQVSMSQANRLLLLSPRTYSSTSKAWTENNQRIQWPTVGKLETWTGTGSGFANLLETGGFNVWSAQLGSQHIIYQTRGIWALNYVGGTTVFSPKPMIPDLGLLAAHLLVSYNNVHYFIGTDYNVHAYYGGTVRNTIGDPIHKYLQDDLDPNYDYRCWMAMGPEGNRLWIFIVPSGSTYITKAYYRNMQNGTWGVRDFGSKFTSTTGFTAVSLVGAQSYTTGDTYAEVLEQLSAYDGEGGGDLVTRYGDKLTDASIAYSVEISVSDFTAGGLDCTDNGTGGAYSTDFTENDIMIYVDGSDKTATEHGTHFYTCYDVSTGQFKVRPRHDEDCELMEFNSGGTYQVRIGDSIDGSIYSACVANVVVSGGDWSSADASGNLYLTNVSGSFCSDEVLNVGDNTNVATAIADCTPLGLVGIADFSDTVPLDLSPNHVWFYSAQSTDDPGETYRQTLDEVRTQQRMVLGDSDGLVYQMDETYTEDDGNAIDCRHLTPVLDWGRPDKEKKWQGLSLVAEGTADGAMYVRSRTSNFDTSNTGWSDVSFDLTSQFLEDTFWHNITSKRIQYSWKDFSGNQFYVSEYKVLDPVMEMQR